MAAREHLAKFLVMWVKGDSDAATNGSIRYLNLKVGTGFGDNSIKFLWLT
jgi:hypothetical protein